MKHLHFILFLGAITTGCITQPEIQDLKVTGVEHPVISLNGTWKFSMDPPEKFWKNEDDIPNWSDIQVPGECQMQGFAIKHNQPYAYKLQFDIPKDYEGKQILLNFYGVYSHARVWVNGHFIREHYGGFTRWECDITDHVTAGESAALAIEIIDRTDDISYGSGYAKHQIGGILRNVELTANPKQNLKELYFETELDDNYRDAQLKVVYKLTQNRPAQIKVVMLDAENNLIESTEQEATQNGQFSIPITNPEKWDAEHPYLYTVLTTLYEDGDTTCTMKEKIGFREVEVQGNKLLVNGKQVKLRGACRHDIHPLLGRMTTEEYDKKDVLLAKECNMNFIRTSHYPPSESFLDYCDEYGIYVEDETAVCFVGSHRTEAYRESGASQNDSGYTEHYLSQLEEMIRYHRNHPSVIIWSIGNENVFGSNFVESYKWVKKNDLTRPVIYSYPGQVPDSSKIYEIVSMHYPSWDGKLDQYEIVTTDFSFESLPMLFDEWAHVACYNNPTLRYDPNVRNFWAQSLDSMWTNLFEADGALGGAIWCMLDETFMLPEDLPGFDEWWGILDPNIIPATYMGPTVGYGEWGIVDTWRRKKPEFWGTKKAYSPTKIYTKQLPEYEAGKALSIPVHNRFDHTNFSELRITWKYENQSGTLKNIQLEPHQKGDLIIPENEWKMGDKINICFYQNDTMLVDEYNIQLGKEEIELPVCEKGTLSIEESEAYVEISGKEFVLNVNKKTGLLEDVRMNGEIVIKSGPYLNFKLPGNRVQYSTIQMQDYAENWHCTSFKYEMTDGIVTITSEGKYDNIEARFYIMVDERGVFEIDYSVENAPEGESIQEAGLKFIAGRHFEKLTWNRNSYFTAYPETHMGKSSGEVNLLHKPVMKYREFPDHDWEMDTKGYYYFGLKEELPLTNIARSLKENIYSFSLKTKENSTVEVLSKGDQACRFDMINGEFTLIINDQWDYRSLLWGNFMKLIPSEKEFSGSVVMVLSK